MCGRRPGQTHEITDQVCTRELAQNQTSYLYTVAAVALGFQGITQVVPGLVHIFKDDGGANSIAGIALGQCETEVLVLFTALGKVQIMYGCCLLFVLLRKHRSQWMGLVQLLWALQISAIALDLAEYRTISTIAPEAPGRHKSKTMLALTTVAGLCLWWAPHGVCDKVFTRELTQRTSYRYTVAAVALGFQGITQVVPGLVHIFKDDGGANSIAGIALGQCETEVLVLFTALGKVQIMYGCCLLFVLLRKHRSQWMGLVQLLWALQISAIALDLAEYRTISTIAPEAPGRHKSKMMLALTTVAGLFLWGATWGPELPTGPKSARHTD